MLIDVIQLLAHETSEPHIEENILDSPLAVAGIVCIVAAGVMLVAIVIRNRLKYKKSSTTLHHTSKDPE